MTAKKIDTGTDHLLADIEDGVLTITLNRPEARNAMSRELVLALVDQLKDAQENSDVKCVVLTGAGKGFCAGGDVKAMGAGPGESPPTIDESINRQRYQQRAISGALYSMTKPTLASLPGAAAGAGLSIALACDLRIMASTAIMTTAFRHVGFSGDYGGTFFMTQLVGAAKARELFFLSSRISADEALKLGLTNWVVDPEELGDKTKEIASQLASGPPIAMQYMKENLNRAIASGDLEDCMDLECTHHIHCAKTEDHKNAVQAFINKTKPVFNGR